MNNGCPKKEAPKTERFIYKCYYHVVIINHEMLKWKVFMKVQAQSRLHIKI